MQKNYWLVIGLLLTAQIALSATLRGRVTDVVTGDNIIGATVRLETAKLYAVTGLDGT